MKLRRVHFKTDKRKFTYTIEPSFYSLASEIKWRMTFLLLFFLSVISIISLFLMCSSLVQLATHLRLRSSNSCFYRDDADIFVP